MKTIDKNITNNNNIFSLMHINKKTWYLSVSDEYMKLLSDILFITVE